MPNGAQDGYFLSNRQKGGDRTCGICAIYHALGVRSQLLSFSFGTAFGCECRPYKLSSSCCLDTHTRTNPAWVAHAYWLLLQLPTVTSIGASYLLKVLQVSSVALAPLLIAISHCGLGLTSPAILPHLRLARTMQSVPRSYTQALQANGLAERLGAHNEVTIL